MRYPMVNATHFTMQPRPGVPRSAFDLRHFHKTTFGPGSLIPIFVEEVLPGDSMRLHMQAMVRLAPMLVPVMDNLCLHSWFFFVPNRLTWTHWEEFMGATDDPTTSPTQYLIPRITDINDANLLPGKIADYFGITNNKSGNAVAVNALPFRAYCMIWNEWFRDTSINPKTTCPVGDGPDSIASYGNGGNGTVINILKAKDYFTTARPWPATSPTFSTATPWVAEFGGGVSTYGPLEVGGRMTLGGTGTRYYGAGAPVHGLGVAPAATDAAAATAKETGGRQMTYEDGVYSTATVPFLMQSTFDNPDVRVMINDMRTAAMIQRYLEADQRGGTEYAVKNWFHFGVRSPDARLQRPEFLGGGRTMVTINPVAQTSPTVTTQVAATVLASMGATGYAAARRHGFSYSFTEHGYVIGLCAIRGDLTYQQGIARMWMRRSPFDFYTPETANLGEQAIVSGEIYADGSASDATVFGYQERWAEYRNHVSRTSGFVRSTATTPIDQWHFAQKFTSRPVLNALYLIEDPAVSRSLQASSPYWAQFIGDFMFDQRMVRPLPMFSIPGVGGRI